MRRNMVSSPRSWMPGKICTGRSGVQGPRQAEVCFMPIILSVRMKRSRRSSRQQHYPIDLPSYKLPTRRYRPRTMPFPTPHREAKDFPFLPHHAQADASLPVRQHHQQRDHQPGLGTDLKPTTWPSTPRRPNRWDRRRRHGADRNPRRQGEGYRQLMQGCVLIRWRCPTTTARESRATPPAPTRDLDQPGAGIAPDIPSGMNPSTTPSAS